MASWGCPHELDGACLKVNQIACDPGMRGCVLYGRFVFSNPAKNSPAKAGGRNATEGKASDPGGRPEGTGIPESDL